jgi:hypothetical protein
VTWGKIASWGVAAATQAAPGLAVPPAPAVASALAGAEPLAGYTTISTGQGMCLGVAAGVGRDGQPVQLHNCPGNREQARISVNDGEWATRSQYTGYWAANGDSGPCLSDAPAAVARYFAYLQQLGVGMTVRTLSDGEPAMGATSASDPGTFTTTATMADWPGCVNIPSVRGPGALIMAWFGRQAS